MSSDTLGRELLTLARSAIAARFGQVVAAATASDPALTVPGATFVTLTQQGRLRGCIGNVVGNGPLVATIERMAGAAAFEDPRFPPLAAEELDDLDIEVSVLGPITPCPDPELIEIGRHGLYIRKSLHSGLLLPQVATEWGWDRETFLDQTCVKAGLPKGTWRKSKVEIWWFEAVIF